ncbi:hypothetical protein DH2020_001222 [Rehmannia glutinosa]|uniref:Uncharacterized protein n=1 Tax=Rehmannia glutinosa TaxID=99300 RepID=A0ABR0XYT6_REHGL
MLYFAPIVNLFTFILTSWSSYRWEDLVDLSLFARNDRENDVLQWIGALDMRVMGACCADERLKPLLKLNVSTGMAEDRLLTHLSQHFEPSEVGHLAKCLCVPLVSIRVGKINKQGTFLSPTSIRGNLCLILLPTSELRISFIGDDGSMERLATLSSADQCAAIEIEEISADNSGRSFFIKTTDKWGFYFWCSKKSKLTGSELLKKMKDMVMRKPSLAELSGISEARLNYFACHLRTHLAGSMVINAHAGGFLSASPPADDSVDSTELHFLQLGSRIPQTNSQWSKTNLIYQGSLCPRSNSFAEGLPESLSSLRIAGRKKLRGGENSEKYVSCVDDDNLNISDPSNSFISEKDKLPVANGINPFATLNFVDAFGKSAELPFSSHKIQVPSSGQSHFSPQYCWCPQYALGNSQHLPVSSTESLSLPPLSSLLSTVRRPSNSLLISIPSLNLIEVPLVDFPSLLPEPLVRVFGRCSSTMSTTFPPLNPKLVDPLLPNPESLLEKSARETLRMLMSNDKQNVFATGSRGLYSGAGDVDAISSSSMTNMGLVFLSEKPFKICPNRDDSVDEEEKPSSSGFEF